MRLAARASDLRHSHRDWPNTIPIANGPMRFELDGFTSPDRSDAEPDTKVNARAVAKRNAPVNAEANGAIERVQFNVCGPRPSTH